MASPYRAQGDGRWSGLARSTCGGRSVWKGSRKSPRSWCRCLPCGVARRGRRLGPCRSLPASSARQRTDSTGDSTGRPGIRRALILCGHPGTKEFGEIYQQSVEMIRDALVSSWGYSDEHVWVRCGADSDPGSDPGPSGSRGLATREALAADVAQLQQVLSPDDSLWVIVIGHSHFDGRNVFWNLPGPDLKSIRISAHYSNSFDAGSRCSS